MSDRWMDEREELERMDRERGYGRYGRDREDAYRYDRGLYGDRSFQPRGDHVFGESENGVDYISPRGSSDYAYGARMAQRARRQYARRADADYRGDYAAITRGGAYPQRRYEADRYYSPDHYDRDRWREEHAYRVAYGDHHPDHEGHYEQEPEHRSFWERTSDRVASWFGEGEHRGRGPSGYKRTDERISEVAHERLTDDPWLDASAITIIVDGGEVTLAGTVPDRESKHRAERLVEDLAGVNHVQNNLRISRGDPNAGPATGFGDSGAQISASTRKN